MKTHRATGRDKRGPPASAPEELAEEPSVQFDLEVEGEGSGVRSVEARGGTSYQVESDEEEQDWDVSRVEAGDLLSPETRRELEEATEASVEYFSDAGEDPSLDL